MAVSTLANPNIISKILSTCSQCLSPSDGKGRFCGECGTAYAKPKASMHDQDFASSFQRTPTLAHPHEHRHTAADIKPSPASTAARTNPDAPTFARVKQKNQQQIPTELKEEIGKLVVSLAKQRLFLLMHWCIFLGLNLTGLLIACKAYNGYIGDEMTKCVMAFTPMFFINSIALACLSPIKGTKREVARLQERLTYMRFQVEYLNMV